MQDSQKVIRFLHNSISDIVHFPVLFRMRLPLTSLGHVLSLFQRNMVF